ncbi:MAG: hypothetical protein JOY58_11430, partial [Solirubrobacterales bacterium]|nr:hypothetical protein [Solirubrobacterales bacterium]
MLVRESRGNPLALLELSAGLTVRELEGADPVVGPLRARGAVEESFRARVAQLPQAARRALLIAAADEAAEVATLERCGIPASALRAAEDAGLVRLDQQVNFRHPLVRSAVYGAASHSERREAHAVLASTLRDPVSSAWHKALIADSADEAVASELDCAGSQALARGAPGSAAAAFERAAELTEEPLRRGRRLMHAAQATLGAGSSEAALTLVDRARPLLFEQTDIVELDLVRAGVSMRQGSPAETFVSVRNAADAFAAREPSRALEMVALMIWASVQGSWVAAAITDARQTIERVADGSGRYQFMRIMLDGALAILDGAAEDAGRRFRTALQVASEHTADQTVTMLAGLIRLWIADYLPARDGFRVVAAQRRAQGSLVGLAGVLPLVSIAELCTSRIQESSDAAAEGMELGRQLGYANDEISYLALRAWLTALLGNPRECRDSAA